MPILCIFQLRQNLASPPCALITMVSLFGSRFITPITATWLVWSRQFNRKCFSWSTSMIFWWYKAPCTRNTTRLRLRAFSGQFSSSEKLGCVRMQLAELCAVWHHCLQRIFKQWAITKFSNLYCSLVLYKNATVWYMAHYCMLLYLLLSYSQSNMVHFWPTL